MIPVLYPPNAAEFSTFGLGVGTVKNYAQIYLQTPAE